MTSRTLNLVQWVAASASLAFSVGALAAGKYGPGASDTEIKIGQTMP